MRAFQMLVLAAGVAIALSRISFSPGPSAEIQETSIQPGAGLAPKAIPGGEGGPAQVLKEATFETARPTAPVPLQTPDPAELASEAARSPHGLPASLRRFAMKMAEFMEAALSSVESAVGAFDTLEECAADERGTEAPQTRIICMANAQRLSQAYPERLAGRYSDLAHEAPELAKLVL